jgi:hypothetical protein
VKTAAHVAWESSSFEYVVLFQIKASIPNFLIPSITTKIVVLAIVLEYYWLHRPTDSRIQVQRFVVLAYIVAMTIQSDDSDQKRKSRWRCLSTWDPKIYHRHLPPIQALPARGHLIQRKKRKRPHIPRFWMTTMTLIRTKNEQFCQVWYQRGTQVLSAVFVGLQTATEYCTKWKRHDPSCVDVWNTVVQVPNVDVCPLVLRSRGFSSRAVFAREERIQIKKDDGCRSIWVLHVGSLYEGYVKSKSP